MVKKNMRILFLSDDILPEADVVGGGGIITLRLAKEFVLLGHEVHVITATKHREKCRVTKENGLTITCIHSPYYTDRWRSFRSLYNPGVLRDLNQIISEFNPDIVHAHIVHLYLSYYSLIIAKRHAKVFMTAHDIMPFYPGTFTGFINPENLSCPSSFNYRVTASMLIRKFRFRYNPFRNISIRHILKRIDGVIAVSHELKEALMQNGITVCGVIHNGIEVSEWDIPLSDVDLFLNT